MMMKKPVLILWFMFTSSVATLSILPNVNEGYWLPGQSVQSTYVSVGGILDSRGQLTGKQCGSQANSDYFLGSSTEQDWSLKSAQFYAYCFEQYGNLTNGTMNCNSTQCTACLKVCQLQTVGNESTCWSQCSSNATKACKDGCSFYSLIHNGVSSRNFSISKAKIPRNYMMHPTVGSGDATSLVLKWNATKSQSVIVYVISVKKGRRDDFIQRKRRDQWRRNKNTWKPLNMSMTTSRRINSSDICLIYPHALSIAYDFEVVPVSKHGYLDEFDRSLETTSFKFPSFTYLDRVYVNGPGVFTPPLGNELGHMKYKIHWSGYNKGGPAVTRFDVMHQVTGKQCSIGPGVPDTVSKANATSATISVIIQQADLWKECIFIFYVTPVAGCIYGNTFKTNVTYKGCHTNCSSPTTKPPETTVVIASLKSNSTKFTCTSNNTNSSEDCSSGYYNKTMIWNLPTGVQILEVDCRLYKSVQIQGQSRDWKVEAKILPSTANTLILTNLLPNTNYAFKVYVRTSNTHVPHFSKMAGFSFKTAGIPTKPTTRPPSVPPIATESSTTTLRKPTPIPIKRKPKSNSTIGLAAGLGGALFVVIVIAMLLLVRERRRRKRCLDTQGNTLGGNDFSFVTYQVDPPDHWELQMENIIFGEALGEGAFGKVYVATVSNVVMQSSSISTESLNKYVKMGPRHDYYQSTPLTMKAAVKILQDRSNEQQKDDFLEEIKLMKEVGQHKNIVSMLGCVTRGDMLCLVVEFMPYGDLLHYLRGRRSKILGQPAYANPDSKMSIPKHIHCDSAQHVSTENLIPETPEMKRTVLHDTKRCGCEPDRGSNAGEEEDISPDDLLRFSWQIASGMEFLSQKGFVHRDLAARNVLVGPNKSCKISDFGLTRLVYEEKVYMGRKSRKLPIKWMSTEAIIDQIFTSYSDVWSFGVLVFEIVTLGGTPYPTMTGQEILRFLRSGHRMEKPENCSDEIYSVMKACWLENPLKRPSFTDIRGKFEELISEGTPYVELNLDNSNPYYNVASFISLENSTDSLSDDDDDNEPEWENRFSTFDRNPNISTNSSVNEGFEKEEADNNLMSIDGSGAIVDEEGYLSATRGPIDSVSSGASSTTPLADHLTNQKAGGSNNGSPLLQRHKIKPRGSSGSYVWSDKRNSKHKNIVTSTPNLDNDSEDEHRDAFVTDNYLRVRPTV